MEIKIKDLNLSEFFLNLNSIIKKENLKKT